MKRTIAMLIGVLLLLSIRVESTKAFAAELPAPISDPAEFAGIGPEPAATPEADPTRTFTWDFLAEQNHLETILSACPCVKIYSKMYDTEDRTWLFMNGNNPVMVTETYDSVYGQYKGCYFELTESTDGTTRPRIYEFDSSAGTMENLDGFFLGYFSDPERMQLDRIEEDLIWADVFFAGGYRQKFAFDRKTMVIREIKNIVNGKVVGITGFDYGEKPPAFGFLDSWDRPLRNIEVLWENYSGGVRNIKRETVAVPSDWEYFPAEARWGDYTAYTNDQYIGEYEYPGDGVEYLLFLTTVKG